MTNPLIVRLSFNGYRVFYSYAIGNGIDLEPYDINDPLFKRNGGQPLSVEDVVRYNQALGRKVYCVRDDGGNLLYDRRDEWTDSELEYADVTRAEMDRL